MDGLTFRPHAGHFINCQRLESGSIRLEIQQGAKVCYALLTQGDARLLGRALLGEGPQLPNLPKIRDANGFKNSHLLREDFSEDFDE